MAEPHEVIVFPGWKDNPYLNLMYLATDARNVPLRYPTLLESLLAQLRTAGRGSVLHLHWTAPIVQKVDDPREAADRMEQFVTALEAARARGLALVWTIHNSLPHELTHRELEIELCSYLARTADRVHVMLPGTRDRVATDYTLDPEREVLIPHPSYQGVYAARESDRARWREEMDIAPHERSILFFGQMRPYKGLDVLLESLRILEAEGHELPVLLLAGSTPEGVAEEIDALLPSRIRAIRAHRFIPDSEVECWFGAADLAIYPYRDILNSGSVHLSATMGVPAVMPDVPHLRDYFATEPWVRFFDRSAAARSIARLLAEETTYARDGHAMRDFSERLAPWGISQQLWTVLSDVAS